MKVGDYVRTRDGLIQKIKDDFYTTMEITTDNGKCFYKYIDIIKSSSNIIDLIEVGDYVNGYYVEDVLNTFVNVATGSNYFQNPTIYENDIKSIVTKEQFESMKYKVGE